MQLHTTHGHMRRTTQRCTMQLHAPLNTATCDTQHNTVTYDTQHSLTELLRLLVGELLLEVEDVSQFVVEALLEFADVSLRQHVGGYRASRVHDAAPWQRTWCERRRKQMRKNTKNKST